MNLGKMGLYVNAVRWICVILLLTSLLACSFAAPIGVVVDPDAQDFWSNLQITNPLPQDVVIQDGIDPHVRIRSVRGGYSGSGLVVQRRWLAPVVDMLDVRSNVSLDDVGSFEVVPIQNIVLPKKAIAVDHTYPGEEGYALVWEFIVEFDTDEPPVLDHLSPWLDNLPKPQQDPEIVRIGGVGDIMVQRGVTEILVRDGGVSRIFGDVHDVMRDQDMLLGNLEGAVSTRGQPLEKSYTFRFSPRVLVPLKDAGFTYLSLTNNHAFDYGEVGFLDTLGHLANVGIHTSGAGGTLAEAAEPVVLTVQGHGFSILSVGAYPRERNGFDGATMAAADDGSPGILWKGSAADRAIETAAASGFSILMVHGGQEWGTGPDSEQIALYRHYADLGVDLILGSHSHVVQGIEVYGRSLIAYSLGNFVFPGMGETRYGEESLLLSVGVVDGSIRYVDFTPVKIDGKYLSVDRGTAILDRFLEQSRSLSQ